MISLNKTFLPAKNYKNRKWYVIDCQGQNLGRLATIVTSLLKGKIQPQYHPSIDTGDYVILINADLININKESKHYLVYNPGRPGHSLKIQKVSDSLTRLTIQRAIKRMLSETETKRLMRRLKIYNAQTHLHKSQNPIEINLNDLYSTKKVSTNE